MLTSGRAEEIRRRSAHYNPRSGAQLNYDLLPRPEDFREMELRYRPIPSDWEEVVTSLPRRLGLFWVGLSIAVCTAVFCRPATLLIRSGVASIPGAEIVAGALGILAGLLLVVGFVCFLERAAQLILLGCALLLVVTGTIFEAFPSGRLLLIFLILGLGVLAAWSVDKLLRTFSEEWLAADPRIPTNRREEIRASSRSSESRVQTALNFASSLFSWRRGATASLQTALQVTVAFLDCSAEKPIAPGVWTPGTGLLVRRQSTVWLSVCSIGAPAFVAGWVLRGQELALAVPATVIISSVTGLILLLLLMLRTFCRMLRMIEVAKGIASQDERSWWECQNERLRTSVHQCLDRFGAELREAEHIMLGIEPHLNFPILLAWRLLMEHVYICGRTGSGKTSMGLTQMLVAVLRGYEVPGRTTPKSPVIIIDMKGDPVLFHTARQEAERRGQKFQFFTLEAFRKSHRFNPFRGFASNLRSVPQIAQLVLDSLSLNHGAGYGRGYFSQQSRLLLSQTLRRSRDEKRPIRSFSELYDRVREEAKRGGKEYRDAFELVASIEALTHYPQLVTKEEDEVKYPNPVIQMDKVLEERSVAYFWLPSAMESISVREVGRLVLFNLQTAALDRAVSCPPEEIAQAYLFVDECQKLAGENFRTILQMARSAKIATILANQALDDLNTPDFDLRPTIKMNTRTKLYFSVSSSQEAKEIAWFSGEELQALPDTDDEVIRPRLGAEEILSTSDHPQRLFLHVAAGSGYTQFGGRIVSAQTDWPLTLKTSKERERMPWPDVDWYTDKEELVELHATTDEVEAQVRARRAQKYGQRAKRLLVQPSLLD